MKKNALFTPVLLVAAYLPFEDFLLKWLPGPDVVFLAMKQVPDIIILSLFMVIILDSACTEKRIHTVSTKAFLFLAVFLAHAFLVLYLNRSSYVVGTMNIKALVRYIVLIYLFIAIRPTEEQSRTFVRTVLAIALAELLVGAAQLLGGEPVQLFFKPYELSEETGITFTAMKHDELFGTMAHTINYAYYLMVALVLLLCFRATMVRNTFLRWSFVLLLLAAIFLSGSRSAFLASFIAILLYVHWTQGVRASAALVGGMSVTVVLAFLFVEKGSTNVDFWYFLSPDYLQALEAQRLGLLRVFLTFAGDPHIFYGLSADKGFVAGYIAEHFSLPYAFAEGTLKSLEDVYWVALTTYYGIIGLLLFVLFLFFLYRKLVSLGADAPRADLRDGLVLAARILFLLHIPLNLVGQAFEARQYSFYFWATVGLAISQLSGIAAPRAEAHGSVAARAAGGVPERIAAERAG